MDKATKDEFVKINRTISTLADTLIERFLEVFPTRQEVEEIFDRKFDEKMGPMKQEILTALDAIATNKEAQTLENAARDAETARIKGWLSK